MSKRKFTANEKIIAVQKYLKGYGSQLGIANELGI